MKLDTSKALFQRAQAVMAGGVNSPVRAFRGVGGTPVFFERAEGAWLTDADGQRYLDFVGSWGPMILGHGHPEVKAAIASTLERATSFGAPHRGEVDFAELICKRVPSVEKVRLVSSGTEATLSAIRLARGATGRARILKFEGCYHGHGDSFLVKAGSGVETLGLPDSPGVPAGLAELTLTAPFNDLPAVEQVFAAHGDALAAVILEPIVGNMGLLPPAPGFLEGLRELCTRHGVVLIFDEVMTGFRVAPGGAQERYGVRPDLTTFAKIAGGGLPLGAFGGRAELMNQLAPEGPVYQAGTLSGNPLAVAAGHATLSLLGEPDVYARLEATSAQVESIMVAEARASGVPFTFNRIGSMWTLFFCEGPVTDYASAKRADTGRFGRFFHAMLQEGVYLPPSQFESCFVSLAHDAEALEHLARAARRAFSALA